ncbi:hypothetical protein [Paenibacillus sp. sgz302251]|uniref:hypothetical protein n=1 Tax=Paenibacillus sp. sgz302251 TaxID=3414493 RepID=UPI003C7A4F7E
MNYRNNPGNGNQHNDWDSGHLQAQGPPSKSLGAKSGGFNFGGNFPAMPPEGLTFSQDMLPAIIPESTNQLVETTATSKTGGFSLASLGEIKSFVDRMGGIDGILSTVQKVQKVMSSVSQMAPLVKVLMGSFKKPAKNADEEDTPEWRPKRRKRRKTGSASGTASGGASRRRNTKRKR